MPRCTAKALDRRNAWKRWSIHVPYALGSTFILKLVPISASAARILIWNARKCSPPSPPPHYQHPTGLLAGAFHPHGSGAYN